MFSGETFNITTQPWIL